VCPQNWESLDPSSREDVRLCSECRESVYFCASDAETIAHAAAGDRIARDEPARSERSPLVLDGPPRPGPTPSQHKADSWAHREREIDRLLRGTFGHARRMCPNCGYPIRDYDQRCRVCGLGVGPLEDSRD
jgi:hypothetical protein